MNKHVTNLIVVLWSTVFVFLFALVQSPIVKPWAGIDQQVFLLGAKLQTDGLQMYVDFFDHKGPVFHFLNYIGYLATKNEWGVWAIESLIMLASIVMGCIVLKRICGWLCACLFVSVIMPIMMSDFNYPETFSIWFSLLAISFVVIGVKKGRLIAPFALAGVLGALTFFSKQTCVAAFVGIAVYLFASSLHSPNCRVWLCSYFLGGLATSVIIMLVMGFNGNLTAFYDCCFRFNLAYSRIVDYGFCESVLKILSREWLLFGLSGVAFCCVLLLRRGSKLFYLAWLIGFLWEFFFLAQTGRLYPYQFHSLKVCLWLSITPILYGLIEMRRGFHLAAILLVGLFVVCHGLGFLRYTLTSVAHIPSLLHQRHRGEYDLIVSRINSLPWSDLFIWGNTCEVFSLTGRKCPLPYYYWAPVLFKGYNDGPMANELIRKIEKEFPCIVLDTAKTLGIDDYSLVSVTERDSDFKRLLREYVKRTCVEVTSEDDNYRLYVPKEWQVPAQ